MTHQVLRELCLSLPLATADFPFDEFTEVFRVKGKIFALTANNQFSTIKVNLKCDPELAADLRKTYPEIVPGWHMNHRHWNTVTINGELPDERIEWLVRHSYDCVLAGLPKRARHITGDSGQP